MPITVKTSKKHAAAEQIDQAIRLWQEGFFASAVTLAGAAEGSMPEPTDGTLFGWLKIAGLEALEIPEKQVISEYLNHTRDWLKHSGGQRDEIEITPVDGFFMLARAYSKFIMVYGHDAQTDTMRCAIDEIRSSVRRFIQPFLEAIDGFKSNNELATNAAGMAAPKPELGRNHSRGSADSGSIKC